MEDELTGRPFAPPGSRTQIRGTVLVASGLCRSAVVATMEVVAQRQAERDC